LCAAVDLGVKAQKGSESQTKKPDKGGKCLATKSYIMQTRKLSDGELMFGQKVKKAKFKTTLCKEKTKTNQCVFEAKPTEINIKASNFPTGKQYVNCKNVYGDNARQARGFTDSKEYNKLIDLLGWQ